MKNPKIKSIEEIAEIVEPLKAGKKKVVLCHGVFDLLHIGHIRHFEQAKAQGDVLVVTVTPDRFVNKGPGRPAFPEDLRVEAIAGLKCVDFVAVNRWPMACETIELLRPNLFAKGGEYKEQSKDRTGNISVEEQAIRQVGGEMILTDDVTFSSSSLINRHLSGNAPSVLQFLEQFSARYSSSDIIRCLENAKALKVLTIGETIIDEYQYCEAIGKSSKEPMIAVRHLNTEKFAGGIVAVANHLASVCDSVGMVSFLGADGAHEEIVHDKLSDNVDAQLLRYRRSPTIVKRRLIENYFFQKLIEVYEFNGAGDPDDDRELAHRLRDLVPQFDAVLVVDYGHGMINEESVKILCEEARFLAVNAQSNAGNLGYHTISKYRRADYISLTEGEIRLECRDRRGDLKRMILEVSRRLDCPRIMVTRGKNGCIAYCREEGFFEIPAFASKVVDRMGAGDSFVALTTPCMVQKAPMEIAGFIGNAVGAQAVATVGHRTSTERIPLFRHIECLMK